MTSETVANIGSIAAIVIPALGLQLGVLYKMHLDALARSDERADAMRVRIAENTALTSQTKAEVQEIRTIVDKTPYQANRIEKTGEKTLAIASDIEKKVS